MAKVLSLACLLFLVADGVAAQATKPSVDIAKLAFLEGTWIGQEDGLQMEEHWTSISGGALVGMHKDVKDGSMVSFEFCRIAPAADGTLTYYASPGGAPATLFRLKELADRRVVFENPDHDFPQRILYWLEPDGRLGVRIEGEMGGKLEAMEWRWTRKQS
jgi:Domain of unknown function (DUF6265)